MFIEFNQFHNNYKSPNDGDLFYVYIKRFYIMACNCEGKTYNIGMGCCVPVLAPIENYYTKTQVNQMFNDLVSIDDNGIIHFKHYE